MYRCLSTDEQKIKGKDATCDVRIKKPGPEITVVAEIEAEKIDHHSKISVQDAIEKYPEIIRDVARIIVVLPPTQVSIE